MAREQTWLSWAREVQAEPGASKQEFLRPSAPHYTWEQEPDNGKSEAKSSIADSGLREGQDLPQVTQQVWQSQQQETQPRRHSGPNRKPSPKSLGIKSVSSLTPSFLPPFYPQDFRPLHPGRNKSHFLSGQL